MRRLRKFGTILRKTFIAFVDDDGMKLGASLSYYTIFSLGPILLVAISLAGIFFGREAVQGKIYGEINGMVGHEAALQIQNIIQNIEHSQNGNIAAIVGAIILFIGATTVFTEIQHSINFIWSVKAKPQRGWLKFLTNRLLSFSLIIGLGFLLLVSLVISALVEILNERLMQILPDYTAYLLYFINQLTLLIVTGGLFAIIFKVLPDAIIKWKDALVGSIFTAALFLLGKFLIGYYLGTANLGLTYGAAASILIILVWVYYSSVILYFGAEFTRMYAIEAGSGIRPTTTGVFIVKKESKEIPDSYIDT
jgi:membrane protein